MVNKMNRKIIKFGLIILTLSLLLVLSTGCDKNTGRIIRDTTGDLVISTNISSDANIEKIIFEINNNKSVNSEEVYYDGSEKYTVKFDDLEAGVWQIKITAYLDDGSFYGEANKEVEVISGEIVTAALELDEKSVEINGTIEIEHNFPFSVLENQSFYDYDIEKSSVLISQYDRLEEAESNELIIRFKDGVQSERKEEVIKELGFVEKNEIKRLNMHIVDVSVMELDKAIDLIESYEEVKYVTRNRNVSVLKNLSIPDDPGYNKQWGYPLIRMPQLWKQIEENNEEGGRNPIRVAVLDTGIDYLHEDLADNVNVDAGYNFSNEDEDDFMDRNGHGTHVAGTIGAINNNIGVSGIMQNVELIPIKVLGDGGGGGFDKLLEGMYYAAGLHDDIENPYPANIINLSLGALLDINKDNDKNLIKDIQNVVNDIVAEGIKIVAASGNDDKDELRYPAKIEDVIAVGSASLDRNDYPIRSSFSNYSSKLDFIAPGYRIFSTKPGDNYNYESGTSMAAPHVSGVIGLMFSKGIDSQDVRRVLHETSMKLSNDNSNEEYGYGLINAYWAINQVSDINIILNRKVNGDFEVVKSKQISLDDDDFSFEKLPSGEYKIDILIDVQNTGKADPGDYFSSKEIVLEEGEEVNLDFVLKEFAD